MRTYKTKTIHAEHFDSVNEFVRTIESRELTKHFADRYSWCEPVSQREGRREWYGTETFADAQNLLRCGYPDGAKAMLDGKGAISVSGVGQRSRIVVDRVGTMPHVPNAVIGLPNAMMRRERVVQRQKTINLYYEMGAADGTDEQVLYDGGRNTYAFIKHLESVGYRVQLHIFLGTFGKVASGRGSHDQNAVLTIKAKDYRQPVNPLLISYPLTHLSFFRRHGLRWIETSPATAYDTFVGDYGKLLKNRVRWNNDCTMQEFLRKNGIIEKDAYYLDCEKVARATSIQDIMNLINLK